MDPASFWLQTPRLFDLVIRAKTRVLERERTERAWLARTTAVLMRWQGHGFPTLKALSGVAEPVRKMTPAEVKSAFAAMRAQL